MDVDVTHNDNDKSNDNDNDTTTGSHSSSSSNTTSSVTGTATASASKQFKCRYPKCECQCFDYIPITGSQDLRCRWCKCSYRQHDYRMDSKRCMNGRCVGSNKCPTGFQSSTSCHCGTLYGDHQTLVETYDERKRRGGNVVNLGNDRMHWVAGAGVSEALL